MGLVSSLKFVALFSLAALFSFFLLACFISLGGGRSTRNGRKRPCGATGPVLETTFVDPDALERVGR